MPRLHAVAALARATGAFVPLDFTCLPFGIYQSSSDRYIRWCAYLGARQSNLAAFTRYLMELHQLSLADTDSVPIFANVVAHLPRDIHEFWITERAAQNRLSMETITYHYNAEIRAHTGRMLSFPINLSFGPYRSLGAAVYTAPSGRPRRYSTSLGPSWMPFYWIIARQ